MRRSAKPEKAKVEAKPPVARKSPEMHARRLHGLETDLAEALEQRAALSEILQVIRQSRTDVQPVFETILRSAKRLCHAVWGVIMRVEGDVIDVAALDIPSEGRADLRQRYPAPLSAQTGSAQAARDRRIVQIVDVEADPTVTDARRCLARSGTHLLSLINDILDLSKIEAGRMELELTDFHLPQAIDNALILVRERAGRRRITLEHSVDERLGEMRGDERKVKQVLLNLLSNALKFTPEGGRVEVRAGMVDGMAEISVADTGVGIAPADQEAVFEEFRQVGTAEKKAEGTGLGLTLCRKFVELHGGRIWVKSQIGVGSAFSFTLPIRRGA